MKKFFVLLILLISIIAGMSISYANLGSIDFYSKKAGDVFYPETSASQTGTSDARPYFRGWASTRNGTITGIVFDIETTAGMLLVRYTPSMDFNPPDKSAILAAGGKNAVRFEGTMNNISNQILIPGTKYVIKIHVFYTDASGNACVYALPVLPDASGNRNQSAITLTYKNKKIPPAVLDVGDGYSVTWVTESAGIGWITYKYQGKSYTVYDEKHGIKRTDDTIHFVKVPKAHLDNNTYTIYFKSVTTHEPYNVVYGSQVNYGSYNFRGYRGQADIKMLTLSDVHGYEQLVKKTVYQQHVSPDLLLLNGDIYSYLQERSHLYFLFRLAGDLSGGECPVFYNRGNHETRGKLASTLLDYFPTPTGKFYYTSSYGPVRIICMDMGEDKTDDHVEYGGLVEFAKHRQEELAWLKTLTYDDSYTYTINFCHTPGLNKIIDTNFATTLSSLGVSLSIAGHTHTNELRQPKTSVPFYVFIEGAHQNGQDYIGSLVTLKDGKNAHLRSFKMDGTETFNQTIDLSTVERTVLSASDEEEENIAPANVCVVSKESERNLQATISITAPPVIFETGGDNYTVCWETSLPGTGSVIYTYNGTQYTVNDSRCGNIRSQDTIHSVSVPKKHLQGNSYKVYSKNMVTHEPYNFEDGPSVTSGEYFCVNPKASQTIEFVVVPDLKATTSQEAYGDLAKAAVDYLQANPRILVLNGDASTNMQNKAQFGAVLRAAAKCGGSSCPTVFVRGNLDCRGSFAYHLIEYLKPQNGEYYYTFTYGNVSAIVLDGGEDKVDDHAEYFGLVDFTSYRAKQTEWLKSVSYNKKAKVKVVIKHFPKKLTHFADDWETILLEKGTNFALYGNSMKIEYTPQSDQGYPTLICGGITGDRTRFLATRITFSNQYAHIYGVDNTGAKQLKTVVDITDGTKPGHGAALEPPTEEGVYLLSCPEHLLWVQQKVAAGDTFSGKTLKMTRNIDMKFVLMEPIGGNIATADAEDNANAVTTWFEGTFDGNGYLLKNLRIEENASFVGLFGFAKNAKIKNLEIYGGRLSATGMYFGPVAGSIAKTTVENCSADVLMHATGEGKTGGLVGFVSKSSTVHRCSSDAAIIAKGVSGYSGFYGGITGQVFSGTVNISDCYFSGEIFGGPSSTVGGIIAYGGNLTCNLSNSYNRGKLYGTTVGQIWGSYKDTASHTVNNCYYMPKLSVYKAFSGGDSMTTTAGTFTATGVTATAIKAEDFPATLSESFAQDTQIQNGGYPILAWQVLVAPTNIAVSGKTMYKASEAPQKTASADNAYETTLIVLNEAGEAVDTTGALPIGKYTATPTAYDKYGTAYKGSKKTFYVSQSGYIYPDANGTTVNVVTSTECPTEKVVVATYEGGRMVFVKTYAQAEEKTITPEGEILKVFLWNGIAPQSASEELLLK